METLPTIASMMAALVAARRDRCNLVQEADSDRPLAFYVLLHGNAALREVGAPLVNLFKTRFPNPPGSEPLELILGVNDHVEKCGHWMRDSGVKWVYSQLGPYFLIGMWGNDICIAAEPLLNGAGCTTNII